MIVPVEPGPARTSHEPDNKHEQRRALLECLIDSPKLTPDQIRSGRALIMVLELAGKLSNIEADTLVQSIVDRGLAHKPN